METGIVRLSITSDASLVQSGAELSCANQRKTQHERFGKWIQFHRLLFFLHCFIHAIQGTKHIRPQVMTLRKIGVKFQRACGFSLRSPPIPPVKKLDGSHRVMRLSIQIIQFQCLLGSRLCLGHDRLWRKLPRHRTEGVGIGQAAPRGRVIRLKVNGSLEVSTASFVFVRLRKPVVTSQQIGVVGFWIDMPCRAARP
jgi:hypothetical protein